MLQRGGMRLFVICSLGLVTAACSLSMNPDLPSAGDSDGTGVQGSGDGIGLGGDGDGNLDTGGTPTGGPNEEGGMGGARNCEQRGGAGGSAAECEAAR
jgi:hypothetical protein